MTKQELTSLLATALAELSVADEKVRKIQRVLEAMDVLEVEEVEDTLETLTGLETAYPKEK